MTKHEADVIGGLNMTDQISNEAYKQIMIVAQDENEVDDVLDKIRAEIEKKIIKRPWLDFEDRERDRNDAFLEVLDIIDKYKAESEDKE